jgi:DNA-binding transcriptional regulator YiaG
VLAVMVVAEANESRREMKKKNVAKLVQQARKSLGLTGGSQQNLLRQARQSLGVTNGELATALGVSLHTLMAWLAPDTAAKHRGMPVEARLILKQLLSRG